MTDILFFLFPVFFVMVAGIILYSIIQNIVQWEKNNQFPVLTVEAFLVAKRISVSHHNTVSDISAPVMMSFSTYYLTFQVESGDRMEFSVKGKEYGLLAEGDKGKLTFQGSRYLQFERERE